MAKITRSGNSSRRFLEIYRSLSFRLILSVGAILFVCISAWTYYNIKYQKEKAIEVIVASADRLGNTIRLGTHYAMMLNSRDDINQIIKNIGEQKEIESVRIYNKAGQIKYSNKAMEVDQATNIRAKACYICHRSDPPTETLSLAERTRIFDSSGGHRFVGIISPIYNEPGCSAGKCHFHPKGKRLLGALDVVVSLEDTDQEIVTYEKKKILFAVFLFLGASTFIGLFLLRFVNRPINKLIEGTRHIGRGEYDYRVGIDRDDEIGHLAVAINRMGGKIGEKQEELNKQKREYQDLFELAPCYVTVQDRDYRLLRYNREFKEQFNPEPGDYCYRAYKSRSERCEICPVFNTFQDGKSHYSEEEGIDKDGIRSFWMVRTAPIRDAQGNITAAMEMCLDVTQMKFLEDEARKSEEKYRMIFNTIPNPVFVLDKGSLEIMDCNDNVTAVYGFSKDTILNTSFLNLFEEDEREVYENKMTGVNVLNQVRQIRKDGHIIYVNIRISSTGYRGQEVLLVTTSDITERLMAEQQLIQGGKMATLGEMATGVAHELNQPLSVIKTASSFMAKKVRKGEPIEDDILGTLTEEIDSQVDRASKIITHMREFGRKSDVRNEEVQVNDVIKRSLEIFIQQLKLREIEVVLGLQEDLPAIMADSNRLEQVLINLLINARDAVEERWKDTDCSSAAKKIFLRTRLEGCKVIIEVEDTGTGIPESILDKIFEPFFTTKRVGMGTGLGLSISYGIIQAYHGIIRVETKEKEGTTFVIQFPVPNDG
ncbi:MAG: PAS domain S-box protein [Desulfobacteraceae bacterium]|nr:PAS domain S-box protein [Desulfobacteraceae bacterium]